MTMLDTFKFSNEQIESCLNDSRRWESSLAKAEESKKKINKCIEVVRTVRKPNTYVIQLDDGNELYLNELKNLDNALRQINEIQNGR